MRMGEFLMACGWTIRAAAWSVLNWDLYTLAAAIANEKAGREFKLSPLSANRVTKLAMLVRSGNKATVRGPLERRIQVDRDTIRINLRLPQRRKIL